MGDGYCLAEESESLHARPWAFGVSDERADILWKKGMGGAEIKKRSTPQLPQKGVDTSGGINRALDKAARSSVGLSMETESSKWKAEPDKNRPHPDEDRMRESKKILRAYAGLQAGEDFNISIGPELIIKDENRSEPGANENEPDSSLGIGMKFKYDF